MLQLKDKCESLLNEKEVIMVKYDIENCMDLIITRKYKYKEERIEYETYDEMLDDYKRLLSSILKTNDVSTKKLERDIIKEKNRQKQIEASRKANAEKQRAKAEMKRKQEATNIATRKLLDEKYNFNATTITKLKSLKNIEECERYLDCKFKFTQTFSTCKGKDYSVYEFRHKYLNGEAKTIIISILNGRIEGVDLRNY